MKYFLDTEFIEYPRTIDLISIAIVAEDGRELYMVNSECDCSKASEWVRKNVLNKIDVYDIQQDRIVPLQACDYVASKLYISKKIRDFIGYTIPEFWGYYCDYDWVVFCWLFGSMINLPKSYPMYCRDLKQLIDYKELAIKQDESNHNALEDARWIKNTYKQVIKINGAR